VEKNKYLYSKVTKKKFFGIKVNHFETKKKCKSDNYYETNIIKFVYKEVQSEYIIYE